MINPLSCFQARSIAVGGGPAGGGCRIPPPLGKKLKLGSTILHSGHFWHCVTISKKTGPAKAAAAGPAATPGALVSAANTDGDISPGGTGPVGQHVRMFVCFAQLMGAAPGLYISSLVPGYPAAEVSQYLCMCTIMSRA